MLLELKGNEATINSTATVFTNATYIKLYLASGTSVITITDADDNQLGNTTIISGVTFIKKHPTEKIAASSAVLGTPVTAISAAT